MRIVIKGAPISKKRPRSSHKNGVFRTHTAQKKETNDIKRLMRLRYKGEPLDGSLRVNMTFCMTIPESYSNKKKSDLFGKFHIKRPDVDNLAKFYLDCLNGIAWHDDSQVGLLLTAKIYSGEPKVIITVEPTGSRLTMDEILNHIRGVD